MSPTIRSLGLPGIGFALLIGVVAPPGGGSRAQAAQEAPAAQRAAAAQQTAATGTVRAAARLSSDTVAVGEPFTVGIVATAPDTVRFPPLLETGDAWEQLAVARVEREEDGTVRAFYRLVAWETGRLVLPALTVSTGAGPGRQSRLELPSPFVRSVLPAGAEDLKLRGPRPPSEPGFPWWLALALLLLAGALAWWWRRRGRRAGAPEGEQVPGEPDAAERARAALVALRARATSGELDAAAFYDRLEEILREYLTTTREWPPTRPVRASSTISRGAMRELHRRAVLARFAAVESPGSRRVADVDASLEWLTKDAA